MTGHQAALLTLSGRTAAALEAAKERLAAHLRASADSSIHDVALTLQSHRRHFRHRQAVPAREVSRALDQLGRADLREARRRPSLVFMFPGQGAEFQGMASTPYSLHGSFRADIDRGAEVLRPLLDVDIREILLERDRDGSDGWVHRTDIAQPALLLYGYALGRLLISWGLRPSALIGHSVGEYAAACMAREMSFPDALTLVALRGSLMQRAPAGGMLVTLASEESIRRHLQDVGGLDIGGLDIAAVNAPDIVVVAGTLPALDELRGRLDSAGVLHRAMPAQRAFHSRMMADAAEQLGRAASAVTVRGRRIDVIGGLDGELLPRGGLRGADYWANQLRAPVQFYRAVQTAMRLPEPVLVEVGPGRALTGAARQVPETRGAVVVPLQPDRSGRDDGGDALVAAVGELWAAGADVDWEAFRAPSEASRIPLPTYPFARTAYWLHPADADAPAQSAELSPPAQSGHHSRTGTVLHQVIGTWRDMLGTAHVAGDSNFFDLGGESLLFIRMVARIRRQFDVVLAIDEVSRTPTPGALAALVVAASSNSATAG